MRQISGGIMRKRPIVALIYDFDGTLSPGNMQEFGFIQAVGKTPQEFWKMSDGLAAGQDASNVLSYMKMMYDEAKKNGITLRKENFKQFGQHIQLGSRKSSKARLSPGSSSTYSLALIYIMTKAKPSGLG